MREEKNAGKKSNEGYYGKRTMVMRLWKGVEDYRMRKRVGGKRWCAGNSRKESIQYSGKIL